MSVVAVQKASEQIEKCCQQLGLNQSEKPWLLVSIADQKLYLLDAANTLVRSYPVSTATKGPGNKEGSNQTPLGLHAIAEKIGGDCESGSIFKGRKTTGECAVIEHSPITTDQDFITSRIMWLKGMEAGVNQGDGIDSYERYIYIHGTHEEGLIGQPASIGCVRMKNNDVIALFDQVDEGSWVYIIE